MEYGPDKDANNKRFKKHEDKIMVNKELKLKGFQRQQMELLVIQLWLMERNLVVLPVLLVNMKHAKTSMNPLVLNHNVIIPSATVYMLVIIVVNYMINVFGTSCWYPLMEVFRIWYHEKWRKGYNQEELGKYIYETF